MTKLLEREIEKLKKHILALSATVEDSVFKAVKAVMERDERLAGEVIRGDEIIDSMEVDVEEECLKILALHQPVAIDLRFIVAVLKMDNDLERIGDLAVNIAWRAESLAAMKALDVPKHLVEMGAKVKSMLRKSLDALVNLDVKLAREVCASDDEVDLLNHETHKRVRDMIRAKPEDCEGHIYILSVSRNLERIADHTTNIAEDVMYMVEGEIVRHGRGRH